ncbi:hypothetical protein BRADI_2g27166v3 [Brachypodium distachyon]|uniref:Uncharacterized protein n=1 Tax=Brachypodium distachyon TaxID=15368 RepID=A0A2K2DAV8_BRADI|nr:hypothetical protein BRADI_2g27166v3 [Brachypodium distachyon]
MLSTLLLRYCAIFHHLLSTGIYAYVKALPFAQLIYPFSFYLDAYDY